MAPLASISELLFEHHVPYDEDKKMLIDASCGDQSLTFKEVKCMALCVAEGLKRAFGLKRGEVVAIYSPNHLLFPVLFHGIIAAVAHLGCQGGIVVPLDATAPAQTLADVIDQVNARILITHEELLDKALEGARVANGKIDTTRILMFGDQGRKGVRTVKEVLLDHGVQASPVRYQPDELKKTVACLYLTSGSTGRKKAVMITHAVVTHVILEHNFFSSTPKDIAVSYTGFSHSSTLWLVMLFSMYYGIQVVLLREFDLEAYCEVVQRFKVTMSLVQPWVMASIAREPVVSNYDMSSLQFMGNGGAALDKSVLHSLQARFPIQAYNVYGLTEAIGMFDVTPEMSAKGSVGVKTSCTIVKLVDENGTDVTDGKRGELWVKGPIVNLGYYNDPEMTANAIDSEGFFHTGDTFYINDENEYVFVGRKKELIKYHLHHIHPQEIESILGTHPKVTDCGVIGIYSDEQTTELPRAYVTLIKGAEADEKLARELQMLLDNNEKDYLRLRGGVYIVKDLPRTATGKLQRQNLCEIAPEDILAYV